MKSNQIRTIKGALSGKDIILPEVNFNTAESINAERFFYNGKTVENFDLDTSSELKDINSFKRKFGLVIPVTNTCMEFELWDIIFNNQENGSLVGIGLHTTNIQIASPIVKNDNDLEVFKSAFIDGLNAALIQSQLSRPEYMIMGMSLEHILYGIDQIRELMGKSILQISCATWHDAADAALKKFKAKRIGLLSPFIPKGNENAIKMFEDLGYEVVASFGFACTDLVDIGHIPDAAKEKAILEYLATPENKLDAVVQMGTNISLTKVIEKLEPLIGIPILGINATTFWYALRENGFDKPVLKSGRLFREF